MPPAESEGSTVVGPATSSKAATQAGFDFPWAVTAQVIALASLLLPIVGVVIRWISFWSDDRIDAGLSVASPVPELAYVGFWGVLPALVIGAYLILVFRLLGPDMQTLRSIDAGRAEQRAKLAHLERRLSDLGDRNRRAAVRFDAVDTATGGEAALHELSAIRDEYAEVARENDDVNEVLDGIKATSRSFDETLAAGPSSRVLRISGRLFPRALIALLSRLPHHDGIWMGWLVGFIPAVLIGIFVDDVSDLPALVGVIIASYIFTRQTFFGPRFTIGVAFWPLVLLMGTSALSSGLSGRVPSDAVSVSLVGQQSSTPTWSARIAEADGITYFLPCQASLPVIGVRTDDIRLLTYPAPIPSARPDVTLWSVIVSGGHPTFGYHGRCP